MYRTVDVGVGYRQLELGEAILPGDEYLISYHNMWLRVLDAVDGVRIVTPNKVPFRRKVTKLHPAELF